MFQIKPKRKEWCAIEERSKVWIAHIQRHLGVLELQWTEIQDRDCEILKVYSRKENIG
jgi:hypothetical protein